MKRNAVPWSLRGIAMHRLAFLLQVSGQAVRNGLRTVAKAHEAQPVPTGHTLVLELEERWHYRHEPRQKRCLEGAGSCERAATGLGMGAA